jgi:hypothetical protein
MAPTEDAPAGVTYATGAATLRSSAHRAVYSKARKADRGPVSPLGSLPEQMRHLELLDVFEAGGETDPRPAVARLLARADRDVGAWPESDVHSPSSDRRLEAFVVPPSSLADAKAGTCVDAQASLAALVAGDDAPDGVLNVFERMLRSRVLPRLKERLIECGALKAGTNSAKTTFYAQTPPTLRLQPGPSRRYVRPHRDAEYGHQDGEINFWIPLTDLLVTNVDLHVESIPDAGDYKPTNAKVGQAACFHGTSCRHFVPANGTRNARVSLDFRVGVEGFFDPEWSMAGTKADHDRRTFAV